VIGERMENNMKIGVWGGGRELTQGIDKKSEEKVKLV
jgi:hypothetical protein